MKVVAVVGSPRRGGNSDILVDQIILGAKELGAEVDKFYLQEMDLKPCRACETCRGSVDDPCIIQDDMQLIHSKLRECDALIIGTPIYWFNFSAQTKIFIDRWYALGGPEGHALQRKRVAIAMAYADPDPLTSGALNAYRTFQDISNWLEAPIVGFVYGTAWEAGEIASNKKLMDEAVELGKKLCQV